MRRPTRIRQALLAAIGSMAAGAALAADLAKQYPATLDFSERMVGFECTCDEQNVWRLTGFTFAQGERFRVEIGPSQVAFGRHGTNALWAALIPDEPGKIVVAETGQGEHITRGLIIVLRFNGGGSEPLGQQIAGRFIDRRRVCSMSQYRNGPKHTDLGPKHERTCEPSGSRRYDGPVIVLQGQRTMSSAESFALMLAQCPLVTTLGDRTAGPSANPRRIAPGLGIVVNLPRWLDLDPDGKPIDTVGITPDVHVKATPDAFTDQNDPVLEAALERLRRPAQTEGNREGGKLKPRP